MSCSFDKRNFSTKSQMGQHLCFSWRHHPFLNLCKSLYGLPAFEKKTRYRSKDYPFQIKLQVLYEISFYREYRVVCSLADNAMELYVPFSNIKSIFFGKNRPGLLQLLLTVVDIPSRDLSWSKVIREAAILTMAGSIICATRKLPGENLQARELFRGMRTLLISVRATKVPR